MDDVKAEFFSDKSTKFEDYYWHIMGLPAEKNRDIDFNGQKVHLTAGDYTVYASNRVPYEWQTSKTITAKYNDITDTEGINHHILSGLVSWNPDNALGILLKEPSTPFESLPGDTVTVAVTFTDGATAAQTIDLSYDSDGYVTAKLRS